MLLVAVRGARVNRTQVTRLANGMRQNPCTQIMFAQSNDNAKMRKRMENVKRMRISVWDEGGRACVCVCECMSVLLSACPACQMKHVGV